jgi:dihydroorotate dehydrogenase electron transfer subunit
MIFLAEQMSRDGSPQRPLVLMGSELEFPFACVASKLPSAWLDLDSPVSIGALEAGGICARLASLEDFAGVYRGYVTDLARRYLESSTPVELRQTEIFSCGPTPMLKAVAKLAAEFNLPCQVSLEEYMACAVGGCAGCTVRVNTPDGPAMKRVCVDGPVFDSSLVFTSA